MENDTVKRKVGRPSTPHRPVLSTRIPAEVYEKITTAANAAERTVSEEAVWLIERGIEWENAHKNAQTILQKAGEDARAIVANAKFVTEKTTREELKRELRRQGYTYVRGVNGAAWFDPGVKFPIDWIADPKLLEELMERVATRAIEKLAARALQPSPAPSPSAGFEFPRPPLTQHPPTQTRGKSRRKR